ncbi:MAG: YbaN family protein [Acidobacteriota bacterium]
MRRGLLIAAGTLSVGLGILGIFLPLLPTTPFLLLAAACYARSSRKFYLWLLGNRIFGNYIQNYRSGQGIPLRAKIITILLLWLVMLYTAFFVINILLVKILLILIAICTSSYLLSLRTLKR